MRLASEHYLSNLLQSIVKDFNVSFLVDQAFSRTWLILSQSPSLSLSAVRSSCSKVSLIIDIISKLFDRNDAQACTQGNDNGHFVIAREESAISRCRSQSIYLSICLLSRICRDYVIWNWPSVLTKDHRNSASSSPIFFRFSSSFSGSDDRFKNSADYRSSNT